MELVETDLNPIPAGAVVTAVRSRDGLVLRAARWPAAGARRGTVCIFEGRAEYIEKYFEVVEELRQRGFAVAVLDWRGQGGSQRMTRGHLCHVESFADYDRDFDAFIREVVLPDCPPPLFALGHSMGSMMCLRAARDRRAPFARMVLSGAMLKMSRFAAPAPGLMRFATGLSVFLGFDDRPIVVGPLRRRAEAIEMAEDPARRERNLSVLKKAPQLGVGVPTVRWLYSALRAMRESAQPGFAAAVTIPTLLVVPGRDRLVSAAAMEWLAGGLRAGASVLVPGARHEVMMESDPLRQMFWAGFDAFIPGAVETLAEQRQDPVM